MVEFQDIALLVLASSIIVIIVITRKERIKLMPSRIRSIKRVYPMFFIGMLCIMVLMGGRVVMDCRGSSVYYSLG